MFDEMWVISQKRRTDMNHADRVEFVRYLAMWSNRVPTLSDVGRAALCLPDNTLVSEAIAAAQEVAKLPFDVAYLGVTLTPEQTKTYTLSDLSRQTVN